MASTTFFTFLVLLAVVIIPRHAVATEYKVGDLSGWTIKFDYAAWAKGKQFVVGDKLVFSYPPGAHNVFKVNATDFQDCVIPADNEALTTGNDVITLATPGNKWYICGVGQHCQVGGQKLKITVLPAGFGAPAAAPTTPNSAKGIMASGYQALVAVVVVVAMISLV